MIEITQPPNGPKLVFDDPHKLERFCEAKFQGLPEEVVESLLDGLSELKQAHQKLDPLKQLEPGFCAQLGFEAGKQAVIGLETDTRARNTKLSIKQDLPKAAFDLKAMSEGTPTFLDILAPFTQIHQSAVAIHDSMHNRGKEALPIPSTAKPHTLMHVLGHLSQIIMYLPQLTKLLSERRIFRPGTYKADGLITVGSDSSVEKLLAFSLEAKSMHFRTRK